MDWSLVLLCAFAFLAGFIDSIVGGGGLVQVPAFFVLYPMLPVPNVIGTNRLASAVGTSVAAWNYARRVEIPWRAVAFAALGAALLFGSLAIAIPSIMSNAAAAKVGSLLAVAMMLLIAWSRVRLGVHWASDVVGGLAFGLGLVALLYGAVVCRPKS